ncbi:ribonuclease H-like domain-containing protein [Tanacetum coccineum]
MTPSYPPSYHFFEPTPSSSLLHHTLLDFTTHAHGPTADPQPNTHTPPITDPIQSPPHTGLNSPGPAFPTNQPTSHESHNTQTQNSPLPPYIFDPPNPQTNTDLVNEPPRTHLMITRSQSGIVKPIDCLSLNTFLISPILKNPSHALKDPQWRNAMYDEYNALVKNGTWLIVPRHACINMVRSMWLFKHKFHADGTLSRYKARLVANGSSQQLGVDFDETFSPVVKPATIRTFLSLVVSRKCPIHQLDVKNAFLNGDLSETVYMHQPPGFVDARFPNHGSRVAYLLICVDDIILTASSPAHRNSTGLFLSQKKYALQLLEHAHMVHCNPSWTPVDTESKLDLSYAVQQLYDSATTSLVGYTDADWASCPSTRSAEAEYRGVANVVAETVLLRNLLLELHSPLSTATLVYCDNVNAVYMSANPVQHQRTKHIEIDIHFVRDMVTASQVRVLHVPSRYQYADIFSKGLPLALFEEFWSSLSVHPPRAPTAGAY